MKKTLLPIFTFLSFLFAFAANAQSSGIPCPAGCDTDPICVQEDMCFRFEYFGAVDQGNGTTQLKFKVINAARFSFEYVMFELPGQNLPAVSPQASYINRFHYSVQNTFNDSLIKFTGLNTGTYRYDAADVFRYTVDSATFHNGYNSTIEIVAKAGELVAAVTFNLEECEDMPLFPLPVTLVSFTGTAAGEGIALNWVTATEKDNAYFSIQHSTDGRNFESAGYVEGNGTSSASHAYSFNHSQPAPGRNYYRLKQVDRDGKSEYSKIISVDSKAKATALQMTLFPNPATNGEVNIRMEKALNSNETAQVTILDLNGRTVYQTALQGAQALKMDLKSKGLKAGLYLVKVQAGANTTTQKLIIQ